MSTFANLTKSSSSWSNTNNTSSSFTNLARSGRLFGDYTLDELDGLAFTDTLPGDGRIIGDLTFDSIIYTTWSNLPKN